MVRLSLQLEISGLERLRRVTPGTALNLNCLVSGLGQSGESGESGESGQSGQSGETGGRPQHTELIWSERRLPQEEEEEEEDEEEDERLVSRANLEGDHTTLLAGFTSLLVTENTEDSWRYSWRLIIEAVSPHNSAVYQCKVRET